MALEHDSESPLAQAVRKAGSQTAFGVLVGKRQSVIHDWLREGRPLPAELVLTVERELDISRHDLRPDLYPREDAPRAAAGVRHSGAGGSSSSDALEGVRS